MPQCPQYKFLNDNLMVYCQLEEGHEGQCEWPDKHEIEERWKKQISVYKAGAKPDSLFCPVCGKPIPSEMFTCMVEVVKLGPEPGGKFERKKPGRAAYVHDRCWPKFLEWWKDND